MQKASLHTFLRLMGFLLLVGLAFASSGLLSGTLFAMLAIAPDGPLAAWVFPAVATSMLLLATWCALRAERLGFAALGLSPTRRRLLEFAKGLVMGAALFGLLAMLNAWLVARRVGFSPPSFGVTR